MGGCSLSNILFFLYPRLQVFGYEYPDGPFVYGWYLLHLKIGAWLVFLLSLAGIAIGIGFAIKKAKATSIIAFVGLAVGNFLCPVLIGPPSGGLAEMEHKGSTKFNGHTYHWSQADITYRDAPPEDLFYKCDRFGIMCKLDRNLSDADRHAIIRQTNQP